MFSGFSDMQILQVFVDLFAEIGIARSIRLKGEEKDMDSSDLRLRRTSGRKGEGDIIIPDAWVMFGWDSRWEDWLMSRMELDSGRPSF